MPGTRWRRCPCSECVKNNVPSLEPRTWRRHAGDLANGKRKRPDLPPGYRNIEEAEEGGQVDQNPPPANVEEARWPSTRDPDRREPGIDPEGGIEPDVFDGCRECAFAVLELVSTNTCTVTAAQKLLKTLAQKYNPHLPDDCQIPSSWCPAPPRSRI